MGVDYECLQDNITLLIALPSPLFEQLTTTNGKKIRAGRGRAGEPNYMEVEMAHHTTALLGEGLTTVFFWVRLTTVCFTESWLVLYGEKQKWLLKQNQDGQLGPAVSGRAVRRCVERTVRGTGRVGAGLGGCARDASPAWVYVSAGAVTLGPEATASRRGI